MRPATRLAPWHAAVAGALTGAGGWLLGVEPVGAVLVGLVTGVIVLVPQWIGSPQQVNWPAPPEHTAPRGWFVVRRLASTIDRADTDPATFRRTLEPRLQELVTERCRELGISSDDERVRRLRESVQAASTRRTGHPSLVSARMHPATQIELVLDGLARLTEQEGTT
jgi:hypothetical protein